MRLSARARVALSALYTYITEVDVVGTAAQIGVHSGIAPLGKLLLGLEELAEQGLALGVERGGGHDCKLWALDRVAEAETLLFDCAVAFSCQPRSRQSVLAG